MILLFRRLILPSFVISFLILSASGSINAAEVLQVSSSRLLQVGDNNRIYNVEIACLNIKSDDEEAVIDLLKHNLRRGTRISLQPKDIKNDILVARVLLLPDKKEISKVIFDHGLATNSCESN